MGGEQANCLLEQAHDDDLPAEEIGKLAEVGGAFDWLKDEPDIYRYDDGEPLEQDATEP